MNSTCHLGEYNISPVLKRASPNGIDKAVNTLLYGKEMGWLIGIRKQLSDVIHNNKAIWRVRGILRSRHHLTYNTI